MKKLVKNIARYYLHKNKNNVTRKIYDNQIKSRLENINSIIIDKDKERKYIEKWMKIDRKVSPLYYRVYRTLSGVESLDFIPDYLYYTYIEPQLNNYQLLYFGEEKNYYDKLFLELGFPETLIRNINGIYFDKEYNMIELNDIMLTEICSKYDSIFIKPSINTGQGKNTNRFIKTKKGYTTKNGEILNTVYLKEKYKTDFIIQENLKQSNLLNKFNDTSINCLRILTYRSVKDNNVHVLNVALKVGNKGAIIDAARAGGRFCGIEEDGTIKKTIQDAKGNKYDNFNGIKISNGEYKIPNYEDVIEISKNTANQNYHHRILALDVMIDNNEQPRIMEVNPSRQGIFIYQATNGPMFGNYTEEILDYCKENEDKYFSKYYLKI